MKIRSDIHLQIIHEISEIINQANDLQTILNEIVRKIRIALNFDVVSIYLFDEKEQVLALKATVGLKLNPLKPVKLMADEGLTGLVFSSRNVLSAIPASQHPNYKYFPETGEKKYECYVGVPILLQEKCLGVLVGQTTLEQHITSAEETMLRIISSRLAGLLEVADRLERLQNVLPEKKTLAFQGKGISKGISLGTAVLLKGTYEKFQFRKKWNENSETKKLHKAFEKTEKSLSKIIKTLEKERRLSESEINIFHAHLMILQDPQFKNPIMQRIKEKRMFADDAVMEEVEAIARHFEKQNEPYLKDRALDFRDIGQKIIQFLTGQDASLILPKNANDGFVFLSPSFGPSVLSSFQDLKISGLVSEKGGETSHIAILAQSLGIPAVSGLDKVFKEVQNGDTILLDGKTGFVFVNPDSQLIEEYKKAMDQQDRWNETLVKEGKDDKGFTFPVQITANIGFPLEAELAKEHGIKDVGLFRTEFSFMQYPEWPAIEEQVTIYENLSRLFPGSFTIRTLDIGGDKTLPYFDHPKEENPLLGLRSIRFSMDHLDLFREQLKAIILTRKKGYPVRILLPMISNIWEVETAKEILNEMSQEFRLSSEEIPPLGIMVEVPGIIFQLEDYLSLVDFISIGTNDLIQYILSIDRNSNTVRHLYSGFHPSVIRALHQIKVKAQKRNVEVSVCGEMAGSPKGTLVLLALGFNHLSIAPSKIFLIRYLCKHLSPALISKIRKTILKETRESEIQKVVIQSIEAINPSLISAD